MKVAVAAMTLAGVLTACSTPQPILDPRCTGFSSEAECIECLLMVESQAEDFQRRADAEVARHAKVMARAMAAALEEDRKAKERAK